MVQNKQERSEVPLYDLWEGLGRRRRLKAAGHNPDAMVSRENLQHFYTSHEVTALQSEVVD